MSLLRAAHPLMSGFFLVFFPSNLAIANFSKKGACMAKAKAVDRKHVQGYRRTINYLSMLTNSAI